MALYTNGISEAWERLGGKLENWPCIGVLWFMLGGLLGTLSWGIIPCERGGWENCGARVWDLPPKAKLLASRLGLRGDPPMKGGANICGGELGNTAIRGGVNWPVGGDDGTIFCRGAMITFVWLSGIGDAEEARMLFGFESFVCSLGFNEDWLCSLFLLSAKNKLKEKTINNCCETLQGEQKRNNSYALGIRLSDDGAFETCGF